MHSSSNRLQTTFSFFTSVAFAIAILTALSSLLYPTNPTAVVKVRNVKINKARARGSYSARLQEFATISFDLDADLSPLYHWNTKQVFCWLSTVYQGGKHSDNEIIFWDAIIPNDPEERQTLRLRRQSPKYRINDISGAFRERNATIRFGWNVQPHVGALTWGSVEAPVEVNSDVEEGRSKWGFTFPVVGAKASSK